MVDRADSPRGKAPNRSGGGRGTKMLHNLPIIGCVKPKRWGRPKTVRGRPSKIGRFEESVAAEINIECRNPGPFEQNTDIVEVDIEITRVILLDESNPNGATAKAADIKAALHPI